MEVFVEVIICHCTTDLYVNIWQRSLFQKLIKGGYLDFSNLTELKNVYITEIYMKK